jgi:putative transposase
MRIVASGANVYDVKLLAATLDQVVWARPAPRAKAPLHLCADAGYKGAPARRAVEKRQYQPHIEQRREEANAYRKEPSHKARRWVVERTSSWLNRFRKLVMSFEKSRESYVALLALAAAMNCWRQTIVIYG